MAKKRILCRQRVRKVPRAFSWVDHRLVRDGHISRCSHEALSLYLLLVTVSDAEGLSYYSDKSVCRLLNMEEAVLASARGELRKVGFIAYSRPLYQVLSLEDPSAGVRPLPHGGSGEAISIGEVLRQAMGGER